MIEIKPFLFMIVILYVSRYSWRFLQTFKSFYYPLFKYSYY